MEPENTYKTARVIKVTPNPLVFYLKGNSSINQIKKPSLPLPSNCRHPKSHQAIIIFSKISSNRLSSTKSPKMKKIAKAKSTSMVKIYYKCSIISIQQLPSNNALMRKYMKKMK